MGSFQSATADIDNISQFSALWCIQQVTDALYRRRVQYIFPMTWDKQVEWQARFAQVADLPRVQGAIDCTQVGLRAPHHHPEMFVNRKDFHSLNVQRMYDNQRQILTFDARYPGSSHDSFILRQTSMPAVFTCPNQNCGRLLGDKTYPLSTWLLTRLWYPSTAPEHAYNAAHCATRCITEQCIGTLKQRFLCLNRSGGTLQYSPQRVSTIVMVCCMLVIMRGQPLAVKPAIPSEEEEEAQQEEGHKEDPRCPRARRCCPYCIPGTEVQLCLIAARFR
uniref:putative nuclease HARBI1 n=1 Tax=Pristiophorus japonicus TaxID=55135 RepID=UPI00398E78D0